MNFSAFTQSSSTTTTRLKALIQDLDLTNTTFTEALNAICLQTKTDYQLDDFAVLISTNPHDKKKTAPWGRSHPAVLDHH